MKWNMTISTIAASALLGACVSSTVGPVMVEGPDRPYQERGHIQWNSAKLKRLLEVDAARADRTETGLLRVRLVFRNKKKRDIVVDVRTLFTDEDGFEKEKTNWEPLICTARTQTQYETVSLGSAAYDYQVIIRDPKDFSWEP